MISKLLALVRASLVSISIVVLLFAGWEILMRTVWPQVVEFVPVSGIPSDLQEGDDGYRSLAVQDDTLGHRYRPNTHVIRKGPEFTVEYRINAQGMRDDSDHAAAQREGRKNILLLGDSFTFGQGVDYDKIWPVLLEQQLQQGGANVGVVKAGVQGYDTRQEVMYLEEIFPDYQPDIVVLAFMPNDLYPSTVRRRNDDAKQTDRKLSLFAAIKEGGNLHIVKWLKRMLKSSDYVYTQLYQLTPWIDSFKTPASSRLQEKIADTKELLSRAQQFCESRGAKFLVVSIPQQFQVLVNANEYELSDISTSRMDDAFESFAKQRKIPWISTLNLMSDSYRENWEPLFFREDGHLNEKGNWLVGMYLFDAISTLIQEN